MGPIESILGMMPGVNTKALSGAQVDERKMLQVEAIIKSMTKKNAKTRQ